MNDLDKIREYRDKEFDKLKSQNNFEGDEDGEIRLEPQRYNIMGADYFMSEMLEMLSGVMGTGATGIIRSTGESYGDDLKESLEFKSKGSEDFGRFLGLLKRLGYSEPQINEGSIVVPSSPTAVEHRKTEYDEQKTCYFLAGILTSGAELLDQDITFSEIECRANGDEKCVFEQD
ncbi:MAG: putative hydrocarbon binding protein [Candidatus Nanohaloarchaea archaeon]|jgi:predicted hydrocarbon binding protein